MMVYYVIKSDFNMQNYPEITGKTFAEAPAYAQVIQVQHYKDWAEEYLAKWKKSFKHSSLPRPHVMDTFYDMYCEKEAEKYTESATRENNEKKVDFR